MRWAVVYLDRDDLSVRVFTNEDGPPENAPSGIIGIGQEDEKVGTAVHRGERYYAFDEQFGGWAAMDQSGLDLLLDRPGAKIVKLGVGVRTDVFLRVLRELQAGGHLPSKSARYPWEPKESVR